jgi:hypothetical protein
VGRGSSGGNFRQPLRTSAFAVERVDGIWSSLGLAAGTSPPSNPALSEFSRPQGSAVPPCAEDSAIVGRTEEGARRKFHIFVSLTDLSSREWRRLFSYVKVLINLDPMSQAGSIYCDRSAPKSLLRRPLQKTYRTDKELVCRSRSEVERRRRIGRIKRPSSDSARSCFGPIANPAPKKN